MEVTMNRVRMLSVALVAALALSGLALHDRGQIRSLAMAESQSQAALLSAVSQARDAQIERALVAERRLHETRDALKDSERRLVKARKARRAADDRADEAQAAAARPQAAQAPAPASNLTPCQQMGRDGIAYDHAFQVWLQNGAPASWDADGDGLPCEQTYGEM
jgi:hypothetical protein